MAKPGRPRGVNITSELSVGLTEPMKMALARLSAFHAISPSQFGRLAIGELLVKQGFMAAPTTADKS